MTEQVPEPLFSYENGMILVLHKVAVAQRCITKALAVGVIDSEIYQAILELRAAANQLEQSRKRYLYALADIATCKSCGATLSVSFGHNCPGMGVAQ